MCISSTHQRNRYKFVSFFCGPRSESPRGTASCSHTTMCISPTEQAKGILPSDFFSRNHQKNRQERLGGHSSVCQLGVKFQLRYSVFYQIRGGRMAPDLGAVTSPQGSHGDSGSRECLGATLQHFYNWRHTSESINLN